MGRRGPLYRLQPHRFGLRMGVAKGIFGSSAGHCRWRSQKRRSSPLPGIENPLYRRLPHGGKIRRQSPGAVGCRRPGLQPGRPGSHHGNLHPGAPLPRPEFPGSPAGPMVCPHRQHLRGYHQRQLHRSDGSDFPPLLHRRPGRRQAHQGRSLRAFVPPLDQALPGL